MQRKNLKNPDCPIARSLEVMGDKWTLLIVREAGKGAERFAQFERNLGIAANILSARLRKMELDGIVEARLSEDGARYAYRLTAKGRGLYDVLSALRRWGEEHLCQDLPSTR